MSRPHSPPPPYDLHAALGYQLSLTARLQERRFEADLKALGLSRVAWCVLLAVHQGDQHPSAIAAFIGIDRTAVSRALKQMEAAGLITRDTGSADKRTRSVTLTGLGTDKLAQANPMAETARRALEARLSDTERATFTRLLAKLRAGDDAPLQRL